MTTPPRHPRLTPTIHRDVKINERVRFELEPGQFLTGTVVGVSWVHIFHVYIILLDEPFKVYDDQDPWKAVAIPGQLLEEIKDVQSSNSKE
ncbi:hypothetical protein [Myxococcus phage Mx1]|nr:hypothetical protein [Myxococcus phage Mx1]